jgi:hypothetical protein
LIDFIAGVRKQTIITAVNVVMKATYDNSSLKLETLDSSFITRCNTIYSVISKQLYALKSISVYNVNDITAMIIKKLRDKTQDKFFIKYHPTTRKICCDQIQRHFKLLTYKSILMIKHKGVTQIWVPGWVLIYQDHHGTKEKPLIQNIYTSSLFLLKY